MRVYVISSRVCLSEIRQLVVDCRVVLSENNVNEQNEMLSRRYLKTTSSKIDSCHYTSHILFNGNEIEIIRSTHHGAVVVLREVFYVVVDCCFLELLVVRLRTAEATRRVALTIEPTENQGILNLDFTSETAEIFQTRKQENDYPGKAYTVGRKLSLGWRYVEWNEKNSCFRGGKRDRRREHGMKKFP